MKYLFSIILFSHSLIALGQEDLSLAQAIQIGLARNYDIRIEGRRVDIASNDNLRAATRVQSADIQNTEKQHTTTAFRKLRAMGRDCML